eukprot:8496068-Pyramimonas_sp.AAC.1
MEAFGGSVQPGVRTNPGARGAIGPSYPMSQGSHWAQTLRICRMVPSTDQSTASCSLDQGALATAGDSSAPG